MYEYCQYTEIGKLTLNGVQEGDRRRGKCDKVKWTNPKNQLNKVIQDKVIQLNVNQRTQRKCPNELHGMDQGFVRGVAVKGSRHMSSLASVSGIIRNFNNEIAI